MVSGDPRVAWVGRIAVMALPAEMDISNADHIREDLAALVARGASLVIADMTATTFCDSAGVAALVRAVQAANAAGAGLRLAASAPGVTRVLTIIGVDQMIGIYPSVAAAMADAGPGMPGTAHPGPAGQAGPGGRAPQPS